METGDPKLFRIISGFFGEYLDYTVSLNPEFEDHFSMSLISFDSYTHQSQYLTDLDILGSNNVSITGNSYSNFFNGNQGDNTFMGLAGNDTINAGDGLDRAIYQGNIEEYFLQELVLDDTSYQGLQIIDVMLYRDGIDDVYNIEELDFNGSLYQVS